MSHPGKTLQATSGEIYAHVFENRLTGLGRGLYWNIAIECDPVVLEGEEWPCGLSCDWLSFPLQGWPQLDGVSENSVLNPGLVEASVYIARHHPMTLDALSLERITGTNDFRARLSGAFNLRGFGTEDVDGCRVSVSCVLKFLGIFVIPENLYPKPSSPEAALALVESFLDVTELQVPVWDRFRFVLEPTDPGQSAGA